MRYHEAIEHLYARGQELTARRKFDLAHMRTLAAALGNPQTHFRSVLVAGTNGKGSTSATLAHILTAAGRRTGLYTSPHLVRVNERIRISSARGTLDEISDDAFAELYFKVDDRANRLVSEGALPHPPSFFEVMTAVAFLAFAEARIEIAVLEVGLGGRLDATNIVDPEISVITDIALDHTEWLGDTITLIAREKAGILRPNGLLVTLPQHPEANAAIGEIAVANNVTGINAAAYMPTRDVAIGDLRNHYTVKVRNEPLTVDSPLPGEHQQRNIALAIATAVQLDIPNHAIANGIHNTQWSGRLELRHFDNHPVLIDVAHNPAGAWTLRSYLSRLPDDGPRTLLFSALGDKAVHEIAQILFPLFDERDGHRILLAAMRNPRAATREQLATLAHDTDTPAQIFNTVEEAWREALTHPGTIIIAGSVYLVGEVLPLLSS
ncbi:MAG: bifunctional folylpolyglutamate synthase/dihydrofolate synthase [Acidobacteria bacterium]|nr:bifunctional folylpolyglutamate synthase/dihydrofolate synthase [Acidobacteriota bacterium]